MKPILEKKVQALFAATAWSPWLQAGAFGLAYFVSAKFSSDISGTQDYLVNCWLPSGLFLGMLLLSERRHWLGLVLAAGLGDLAYNYLGMSPWTLKFMLQAHLGNSASAVLGVWLMRQLVAERPTLASTRELIGLLVFGGGSALPSPPASGRCWSQLGIHRLI